MIGADTGFFFALREGNPEASRVFEDDDIAVSVLTVFELKRLALKKGIPWADFGAWLAGSVIMLDVTAATAEDAASISHATGMPAVDALIAAGLLSAGCRTIYTRDEHFERLARPGVAVIRL